MEQKVQKNDGQGFGIAALVLGIFALLLAFIPCVGITGLLMGILSVIFGSLSMTRARAYNAPKGMGLSGIILGGSAILIAVFWIVFIVGAKDSFKDKMDMVNVWSQHEEEIDDAFDNMESLDDLEVALDKLEGVLDDSVKHVSVSVEISHDKKDSTKH